VGFFFLFGALLPAFDPALQPDSFFFQDPILLFPSYLVAITAILNDSCPPAYWSSARRNLWLSQSFFSPFTVE